MATALTLATQARRVKTQDPSNIYASAFRRRRHYVFGLSVRPSVRPKPEIPSFDLYMGPLVHPTNRNRFTACPSARPSISMGLWYWELMSRPDPAVLPVGTLHSLEWFWVSRRIFIYSHHNTYVFSLRCPSIRLERFPGICRRMHRGIGLKFYMLVYLHHLQNWLVYGRGLVIFLILALFWLSETGEIWGFQAFPGERMEGMTWNFACWCILTTFRTD